MSKQSNSQRSFFGTVLALSLIVFGCAQDSNLGETQSQDINFISREIYNAGGIMTAKTIAAGDLGYSTKMAGLTSFLTKNGMGKPASTDYLRLEGYNGSTAEIIRMGSNSGVPSYAMKLTTSNNVSTAYRIDMQQKSSASIGGGTFDFTVRSIDGSVVATSFPSGATSRSADWWGCVQQEYHDLCETSVWSAIACGAGSAACPECGLVILGAWMISCATQ